MTVFTISIKADTPSRKFFLVRVWCLRMKNKETKKMKIDEILTDINMIASWTSQLEKYIYVRRREKRAESEYLLLLDIQDFRNHSKSNKTAPRVAINIQSYIFRLTKVAIQQKKVEFYWKWNLFYGKKKFSPKSKTHLNKNETQL